MEIEDLKYIWNKESEGFKPKDATELANMLKGKSSSIIMRLKRNVWFELIFTFIGAVGLLSYALTLPGGYLKWTSITILVLFAIYSLYYLKKLRLLNRFDVVHDDIKANLERLIYDLRGYLKFYKRSYSVLYPVFFLLGLLFVALEHGASRFFDIVTKPDVYLVLIPGTALYFILSTWLTSWYLKKLFGNHLEKLEALLRDLEV
ncbi:MAG: hypothetical protein WEB30_14735 [Cyclobacteriaceae bacterium]